MMLHGIRRGCRGGYTLMELLIVIVIMITLVSIALPVAKKVMDDAGPKEASRQLSAFFALAKARAAESGRPWGVWIECDPLLGGSPTGAQAALRQATKFYLAEVPEIYTGDVADARVAFLLPITGPGPWALRWKSAGGTFGVNDASIGSLNYLIGANNTDFFIRFNYAGPWFRGYMGPDTTGGGNPYAFYIYGWAGKDTMWGKPDDNNDGSPDSNLAEYLSPGSDDMRPPAPQLGTGGVPFQIMRQPKRVNNVVELSSGACVDLAYSGMGTSGVDFSGYHPGYLINASNPASFYQSIVVMFLPGGGLDSVYLVPSPSVPSPPPPGSVYGQFSPTGTVHFLIGKVEKVNFPVTALTGVTPDYQRTMFDPEQSNIADPKSLWLSIARTTGSITTSENVPPQYINTTGTRLTYQAIDVNGGSPIQIESTDARRVVNAASDIYGRPAFVELSRSIATGLQQIGGR